MHLVLISSLVPVENPASGFDIANRAVYEGLRAAGHKVSVIGFLQPGQSPAAAEGFHLLGDLEVSNAAVGAVTKLKWLAKAMQSRSSLSSAKMLKVSPEHIETLLQSLQPFDGLVLNSVQLPAAFADIFLRHPSIYVAHNVEADSALENAERAGSRLETFLYAREARYLEQYEKQLTQASAGIWTFAEADRFGFGYTVADKALVLPLVTQWEAPPVLPDTPLVHDIGLIGTWSWRSNRLGLDWFLDQVVPLIPSDLSIAIAGQIASPPQVSHPGVRFLGKVADARAFVGSSAVIPLIARGGTGVQLKTIETFEMGMPSVATRSSLRGIATIPINCSLADDPATFAELLTQKVMEARGGNRARTLGTSFHQSQKAALVDAVKQGLLCLEKQPVIEPPPNKPVWRKRAGAPASFSFAVHEGGKS